jgi:pantothenate kinase
MRAFDVNPNDAVRLSVAGLNVTVTPTDAELAGPITQLFERLATVAAAIPYERRAIAGLAGVPGSGKSTLAALLAYLSTHRPQPTPLAAVSIDGWHWPDATLGHMPAVGPDGEPVTLRDRKGSASSFDVTAIARALDAMRDAHVPAALPAYDRRLHEPVADAIIVPPGVRLVLLEGNYVLLDEPPWDAVADRLELRLFLDADPAACRDRIINRHVIGGCTHEQAVRKYDRNDRLNTGDVLRSRANADLVIHTDADCRLIDVTPPAPR